MLLAYRVIATVAAIGLFLLLAGIAGWIEGMQ
jgi:hypothetical protein